MFAKKFIWLFLFLLCISVHLSAAPADIDLIGDEGPLNFKAAEWDGDFFGPARILEEILDVRLRWYGSLKLLQFNLDGKDFRLRADDPNMQAGDRVIPIVKPRIIDDQLWVPLKDVLEALKYSVVYEAEDNSLRIAADPIIIKRVDWDRSKQQLVVEAEEKFTYEMVEEGHFSLKTLGVRLDEALQKYTLPAGLIWERDNLESEQLAQPLRVKEEEGKNFTLTFQFPAQLLEVDFRREMGQLRVEYEGLPVEYTLEKREDVHVLELKDTVPSDRFLAPGIEFKAVEGPNPSVELYFSTPENVDFDFRTLGENRLVLDWVGDGYIEDINWIMREGERQLVITSSRPMELDSFILEEPKRLVFDLGKTWLSGPGSTIPIDELGIKQARYSQFEPEKVRLVLDLEEFPEYEVRTVEGDRYQKIISFPRDQSPGEREIEEPDQIEPREKYDYDYPHLVSIDKEPGGSFDLYHIDLSEATRYDVSTLTSPDRVIVDIEDTRVGTENLRAFNSTPVKGVRVGQLSNDPDIVRIVFDLEYGSDYEVKSPPRSDRITVQFPRSPVAGRVIVIDPGHGGMDPGAIGPSGIMEKDVVLAISLKLEKLLYDAGAVPQMTRYRDEFIPLRERAEFANRSNADIFISIHANSVARDIPEGTETYVRTGAGTSTRFLAQEVQRQVVETLGLLDRGVKQKNYAVLHPLKMPGILHEVAFLSTLREEAMLSDPVWQQRTAEAIFRALNGYFSNSNWGAR